MQSQIVLKAQRRRMEALNAINSKRAQRPTGEVIFISSRTASKHFGRRPQTKVLAHDLPLAA